MKIAVLGLVMVLAIFGIFFAISSLETAPADEPEYASDSAIDAISVPDKPTESARIGKAAYVVNCAICYGPDAVGQLDVAPSLVHEIHEPLHQDDDAFRRAVAVGLRGHRCPFEDSRPLKVNTKRRSDDCRLHP